MRSDVGVGERLGLIAGGALALALVQLLRDNRKKASTKGDNTNQRTCDSSQTAPDSGDRVRYHSSGIILSVSPVRPCYCPVQCCADWIVVQHFTWSRECVRLNPRFVAMSPLAVARYVVNSPDE